MNVIELAKQCDTPIRSHYDEPGCTPNELQAFANAVLEEAAKKCEENGARMIAIMRQMRDALLLIGPSADERYWQALAAFDKFDTGEYRLKGE